MNKKIKLVKTKLISKFRSVRDSNFASAFHRLYNFQGSVCLQGL